MPLIRTAELVEDVVARRGAIAAFNVVHLETAEALVAAAEEVGQPLILQISQNCAVFHGGLSSIGLATLDLARHSTAPLAVHLDHAEDLSLVEEAIALGFGSVMYDGAALDDDENVARTIAVVTRAHRAGIWVEAELGEIGGKNGAHTPGVRTDPGEAAEFVAATGVDLLAVAVGSSHAMTARDARLDLDLIAALHRSVPVPLVLHGSSGVDDELLVAGIRAGMSKINVSTLLNKLFTEAVRAELADDPGLVDSRRYLAKGRGAVRTGAVRLLKLFASAAQPVAGSIQVTERPVVAALDVGGTFIKAGLVAADGVVAHEVRAPTRVDEGTTATIEAICAVAGPLIELSGRRGVSIVVPGLVDEPSGTVLRAGNLGWTDLPLAHLLQERLGVPVTFGHDVRAAALAEARLGAGAGHRAVWFVSLGTGVAGRLITDGEISDGATGLAGEFGHMVVRPGGNPCVCGQRGCVETICSAPAIATQHRWLTGRTNSAAEIAELVQAGDEAARQVWDGATSALVDALAAVTVLMDPDQVVLGGGLAQAGDLLLGPVREGLARQLLFRPPPEVALATLGDRAGLVGAGLRGHRRTPLTVV